MPGIKLVNVVKKFEDKEVIHNVNFEIEKGSFAVIVGPSGCGKSTILRMIAGLEEITSGTLLIDDMDMTPRPPAERGCAMVFQSYSLYPHLSVFDNMAFSLSIKKQPKAHIKEAVLKAAEILNLTEELKRKPHQLSGGQRQRVAIGRAIVRQPAVFLFDEPLSNLDAKLRVKMRMELSLLHKRLGATMVYVTHDQVEAMTLADKIIVVDGGIIQQIGTPLTLYDNPDNRFVAGFIGSPKMNFFIGAVESTEDEKLVVKVEDTIVKIPIQTNNNQPQAGSQVTLGIRPEHMGLNGKEKISIPAKTSFVEMLGDVNYVYAKSPGGTSLTVAAFDRKLPGVDQEFRAALREDKLLLFDQTGNRIR